MYTTAYHIERIQIKVACTESPMASSARELTEFYFRVGIFHFFLLLSLPLWDYVNVCLTGTSRGFFLLILQYLSMIDVHAGGGKSWRISSVSQESFIGRLQHSNLPQNATTGSHPDRKCCSGEGMEQEQVRELSVPPLTHLGHTCLGGARHLWGGARGRRNHLGRCLESWEVNKAANPGMN